MTPGMAGVIAETVPLMGSGAASRHVANLAGVKASPGALQRRALEPVGAAARSGRGEVVDARPLEPRMYLSIDGTGVPMRREETGGVRGRQADGTPETREAKLAVVYTAEGRDPGTGAAVKDRRGGSFSCLIDSAAAPSGGREAPDFAARLDREARRRGLHDAAGPVVVSDGADWIPNACDGPFGGRRVTFVPGLLHCLERASDAVKAILPAGAERDRRFAEARRTSGRAGRRRWSGSWHPSGTGTGKSRPAAGTSGGTPAGCGTTGSGNGASRSGAASSRADAGSSGCGPGAPAPAGRRGAPTPCWR